MTEAEAREIVGKYEALLQHIAGREASVCDLPIYFSEGRVHVSETSWTEWPCVRIVRRTAETFSA